MNSQTLIAVDPGASGGIAWRCPDGSVHCKAMPQTPFDVIAVIRHALASRGNAPAIFMEQIVKHMGAGIPASTMAVYATNFGILQGAVIYSGARLELITPQRWQKALGLGITGRQKSIVIPGMNSLQIIAEKKRVSLLNGQLKREWKLKLKAEAQRLFPALADQITLGTADALLILEFAMRTSR